MQAKLGLTLTLASLFVALMMAVLPPQHVGAQGCRDAAGNEIPCPEKPEKKQRPTQTPPRPTPTHTPTSIPRVPPSPTPTKPSLEAASAPFVTSVPGATTDDPPIGGMPAWLLGGGMVLGLLVVAGIWQLRRPAGRFKPGSQPPDVGDLGGVAPDGGDLGATEPDVGDLGATAPDSGDLGATEPDVGDLGAVEPDVGDLGFVPPDTPDLGSLPPVDPD